MLTAPTLAELLRAAARQSELWCDGHTWLHWPFHRSTPSASATAGHVQRSAGTNRDAAKVATSAPPGNASQR